MLWFGAYASTHLLVWGRSLDEASEAAIDWIVDHAPGLLCDKEVEESYRSALAECLAAGASQEEAEERAREDSEVDVTCWGHSGIHYVRSWEWGITCENPSRADLLELLGRVDEAKIVRPTRMAPSATTLSGMVHNLDRDSVVTSHSTSHPCHGTLSFSSSA